MNPAQLKADFSVAVHKIIVTLNERNHLLESVVKLHLPCFNVGRHNLSAVRDITDSKQDRFKQDRFP